MKKVLLDNEFMQVVLHKELQAIEYNYKKFIPSDNFREIMRNVLKWFDKYEANKVLAVLTRTEAIIPEDQRWFADYFVPEILRMGVTAAAVIPPKTAFGSISSQSIIEQVEKKHTDINRQEFRSREEGIAWLATQ